MCQAGYGSWMLPKTEDSSHLKETDGSNLHPCDELVFDDHVCSCCFHLSQHYRYRQCIWLATFLTSALLPLFLLISFLKCVFWFIQNILMLFFTMKKMIPCFYMFFWVLLLIKLSVFLLKSGNTLLLLLGLYVAFRIFTQ